MNQARPSVAAVVTTTEPDVHVRTGFAQAEDGIHLYWRLAVLTVRTPALRDRPDDLKALSEHFLASFRLGEPRHVGTDAIQALALHGWPGNVRELRAVLLRAVASNSGMTLTAEILVGKRSVLSYLLWPLTKAAKESIREP